ncbi:MAG TPA: lytic murein transglycosylase B [Pseudomonadales bacterium]|jgi:membrane-bound lytic murein transglycosylase B|nr:lytic murein transglycosylase B [Gammaproteobacteria bacterium]MDP6024761.1 lytic murein transglycosylase B [Pseudomonadales bacterium]MDP6317331.1 lytic murein transglycosylase B [Pseudomonadales bacterium]MDP7314458.1 lytic murein transglycosylase B [Pseudomonadales bacterium]MDP7575566.1 lytic murein transglycosylase B [Pseudomonadales bacterium]
MLKIQFFVCILLLGFTVDAVSESGNYADRDDVKQFVAEMVQEGFDRGKLEVLFAEAQYKQSIIDAISRPAERVLTWKEYQDIFLTESRVKRGLEFMHENSKMLAEAEKKFGVPAVIITSIIGVETMYGRLRGKYRVIDSLSTLAFDYPPRSAFFREELKHFLRLAREEGQDARTPLGSYAGAMGYGQFISSSYRHYAIDFDEDGIRDIWNNPTDAIGSVANYMSEHGWLAGGLITVEASEPDDDVAQVFNVSLKPSVTVGEMSRLGIKAAKAVESDTEVSPILLNGKYGKEYWLGLHNFYVITRYNHSKLYAMAVFQLSERLKSSLLASS